MEVRSVRFNLRDFLGDYLCAYVGGQKEECKQIVKSFTDFYDTTDDTMKNMVNMYLTQSPTVKENKFIQKMLGEIIEDFSI